MESDGADDAPSSNDAVRLAHRRFGHREAAFERAATAYPHLLILASLFVALALFAAIDAAGIHDAQFHRDLICVCDFGPTCRAGV
ncbi:hypothetical protein MYA_5722 [Burkholderia sp. KJ006]|nr:hypothetical protein MYA_5722 [Burkholderia sp. KJ006]